MTRTLHRCFACTLSLALSSFGVACTQFELSDRQMKFNNALQDADNRQVLLNAARASKQYPLYFTAVGTVTSTGLADGSSVGFTIPFGPQNHNIYSMTPSIKLQEGLTVATAPLDTQEFFQGFLSPIKAQLVAYYQNYGWTNDRNYHVFLEEMNIPEGLFLKLKQQIMEHGSCDAKGVSGGPLAQGCVKLPDPELFYYERDVKKCRELASIDNVGHPIKTMKGDLIHFTNVPTNLCKFEAFQYLSELLRAANFRAVKPSSPASPKPITIPTKDANVSIKIQTGDPSNQDPSYGFTFDGVLDNCKTKTGQKVLLATDPTSSSTSAADVSPQSKYPECTNLKNASVVIRSPEAIIYYMGQLISLEHAPSKRAECERAQQETKGHIACPFVAKIFTSSVYGRGLSRCPRVI